MSIYVHIYVHMYIIVVIPSLKEMVHPPSLEKSGGLPAPEDMCTYMFMFMFDTA